MRIKREPKKFAKGAPFTSVDELTAMGRCGWIFWGEVPRHVSWITNASAITVAGWIRRGFLSRAIRRPDAPYVFSGFKYAKGEGYFARCPELSDGACAKTFRGLVRECRRIAARELKGSGKIRVVVRIIDERATTLKA